MDGFWLYELMPFHNVPLAGDLLSLGDVLFAAVLAAVLFGCVRFIRGVRRFFSGAAIMPLSSAETESYRNMLKNVRSMFPIERITFRETEFTRGMKVRVTLSMNKTVEGEFVGINEENVICVISRELIAADKLDNIKEMKRLEEPKDDLE